LKLGCASPSVLVIVITTIIMKVANDKNLATLASSTSKSASKTRPNSEAIVTKAEELAVAGDLLIMVRETLDGEPAVKSLYDLHGAPMNGKQELPRGF